MVKATGFSNGGMEPLWAPEGNELYYRDVTGNKLMSVLFTEEPNLSVGKPKLLFQGKFSGSSGPWGRNYDIAPDGEKFLMIAEEEITSTATQFNVILNWDQESTNK